MDEADTAYERALRADPCAYCGGPSATLDHVVPRHARGDDSLGNLAAVCASCNSSKGAMSLLDFLLRGRWRPVIDRLLPDERAVLMDGLHELGYR